jgi:hypothetical protein
LIPDSQACREASCFDICIAYIADFLSFKSPFIHCDTTVGQSVGHVPRTTATAVAPSSPIFSLHFTPRSRSLRSDDGGRSRTPLSCVYQSKAVIGYKVVVTTQPVLTVLGRGVRRPPRLYIYMPMSSSSRSFLCSDPLCNLPRHRPGNCGWPACFSCAPAPPSLLISSIAIAFRLGFRFWKKNLYTRQKLAS